MGMLGLSKEELEQEHEHRVTKERLLSRNGVPLWHKKADILWDLAWRYGHSGGDLDVESCILDLKRLL